MTNKNKYFGYLPRLYETEKRERDWCKTSRAG